MNYIEQNCTIEHNGQTFTSHGAMVAPRYLIAYLANNNQLTDWHGRPIGTYRITSTWKTPRLFASSEMHQIKAIVDGVTYTGRSGGVGMIFKGKASKS
jgi:hypothetical protein